MAEQERTFVTLQNRGVMTLPAGIRQRHGLDRPGAQVELVERDDGVIELHGHVPTRVDQQWFWSERWQRMEREAQEDVDAGRVRQFGSVDEFLDDLDTDGE